MGRVLFLPIPGPFLPGKIAQVMCTSVLPLHLTVSIPGEDGLKYLMSEWEEY